MRTLSAKQVREDVQDVVQSVIAKYQDAPDTDRETVIERLDEECDTLFGQLVQHGRIDHYDASDLARTAQPCAVILEVAEADAWVEDDAGLWEGLRYGQLASMAYFSLRNLLYKRMADEGHDTNEDYPFAMKEEV